MQLLEGSGGTHGSGLLAAFVARQAAVGNRELLKAAGNGTASQLGDSSVRQT